MKPLKRSQTYAAILVASALASAAYPQITSPVGDGVLNAPYRGTVNWLREACADIPYGETLNIAFPQSGQVYVTYQTIQVSLALEPGYSAWDRSVIRLYAGADASRQELDLTSGTASIDAGSATGADNVARFSFRAIGTNTLLARRYKVVFAYTSRLTAAFQGTCETYAGEMPYFVSCDDCEYEDDPEGNCVWSYERPCGRCFVDRNMEVDVAVAPMTASFLGGTGLSSAYDYGTPVLDVSAGAARLTVPIGRTIHMIGRSSLVVTPQGSAQMPAVGLLLPGAAESVYIPDDRQFGVGDNAFQKIDLGTPWPGHLRGWHRSSDNGMQVLSPEGMVYEFENDTDNRPPRLKKVYASGLAANHASAVHYDYDGLGRVIKIYDHPAATSDDGRNWIGLDRSTAGQVTITTSDGRSWRIDGDSHGWISAVVPQVTNNTGARYFDWKSPQDPSKGLPRVERVKGSGGQIMYEFGWTLDADGVPTELSQERHDVNQDGTPECVVEHVVDNATHRARKEYVASGTYRLLDFEYDAPAMPNRLIRVKSHGGTEGALTYYTTEYQHDVAMDHLMVVTKVVLPDKSEIRYEYDREYDPDTGESQLPSTPKYGFRTRTAHAKENGTADDEITTLDVVYEFTYKDASNHARLFPLPRIVAKRDGLGNATTFEYERGGQDGDTANGHPADGLTGEESNQLWSVQGPEITTDGNLRQAKTVFIHYGNAGNDFRAGLLKEERVLYATGLYRTTASDYDELRRLKTITVDPGEAPHLNLATEYYYADRAASQDRIVRDPDDYVTWTRYDNDGRVEYVDRFLSSITDPIDPGEFPGGDSYHTKNEYDVYGRLDKVVVDNRDQIGTLLVPNSITTDFDYDRIGRLTKKTVGATEENYTYTWQDEIKTATDQFGRGVKKQYDGRGLLERETVLKRNETPDENLRTTYMYDAAGRVSTITAPTGAPIKRLYDAAGRVTEEHHDPGTDSGDVFAASERITTHWEYDGAGNMTRTYVTKGGTGDDNGRSGAILSDETRAYDEGRFNYEIRQRSAAGSDNTGVSDRITIRAFDAAGLVVGEAMPGDPGNAEDGVVVEDRMITTRYDGAGRVDKITDSEGGETVYTRDGRGNVTAEDVKLMDAGDNRAVARRRYDALGRLTKVIDPPDQQGKCHFRTFDYDSRGNLLRETAWEETSTGTGDTGNAKMATAYGYDTTGRRTVEAVLADPNAAASYAPVDYTDAVTRFVYQDTDGLARFTRTYQTINAVHTVAEAATTYDDWGRVKRITQPREQGALDVAFTEDAYAPNGRLATRTTCDGYRTTITAFGYDGHDRVVSQTVGGLRTRFEYDALGRRVTVEDPKGHKEMTDYSADLLGTLYTVTRQGDGLSLATRYTHDRHGNLIEQRVLTSPNQVTRYRYDSLGRRTCTVVPDSTDAPNDSCTNCTTAVYDRAGRCVQVTDPLKPNTSEARWVTTLTYDKRGQLIARDVDMNADVVHEVTESFAYDALGNQTQTERWQAFSPLRKVATTSRQYTAFGTLLSETQGISGCSGRPVAYQHNEAGQRTEVTYPSGRVLTIVPTILGQVDEISLDGAELAKYDYHGGGLLPQKRTTKTNSGTHEYHATWDYDAHRRVNVIGNDFDGTAAASYSFEHDDNGNPTRRATTGGTATKQGEAEDYLVDGFDRLTNTTFWGQSGQVLGTESVTLDLVGNRQTFTDRNGKVTYFDLANPANELARMGPEATGEANLEYDGHGNLIKDADGRHYRYDDRNRLIEVWSGELETSTKLAYFLYDSLGRRVETTFYTAAGSALTTHYYYDGDRVIEEYGVDVQVNSETETGRLRYHVDGGQYVDEHIATYDDTAGAFTYYLLGDSYSVVATGNADGSVIAPLTYSPTGEFGGGTSADFNGDGHVDEADALHLSDCSANGPDMVPPATDQQTPAKACADADLDRDGDADVADMVLFQACMSGSGAAPPGCGNCAPKPGSYVMHGLTADVLADGHVLLFARARHYDPKLGRWLQRDPKGYVDGPNLYEAFGGNPLTNADPMGTEIWADVFRYKKKVNGKPVWVVQYRLNRTGRDLGIRGLLRSDARETTIAKIELWPIAKDLRTQARWDHLIENTRQLVETTQEVEVDVATLTNLTKTSLAMAVALPVAAAVGPLAQGMFSTTTVGITQTTVMGNVAAASFTGGVSWGVGSAVGEGAAGGTPREILDAGLAGFAGGAIVSAPFGLLAPVGLTSPVSNVLPATVSESTLGGASLGETQAAVRSRVMANVAESQAARTSSNIDVLFAKEAQLRTGYQMDAWSMTTLPKGSIVYGGIPGQSAFYTDAATVIASGGSRTTLFQSLQAAADPNLGFRPAVSMYEVLQDIRVPAGTALGNPGLGAGGGNQFFIWNYANQLRAVPYIPLVK